MTYNDDTKRAATREYEGHVIFDCPNDCEFRRYGGSPAHKSVGQVVDEVEQLNDDLAHGRHPDVLRERLSAITGLIEAVIREKEQRR